MNQEKPVNGKSSSMDGSDLPYRTVAQARYRKVLEGNFRLSLLFTIQGVILTAAGLVLAISAWKGKSHGSLYLYYSAGYFVSMLLGRQGLQRGSTYFLKQYASGASFGVTVSVISLLHMEKAIGMFKGTNEWGASKFEVMEMVTILLAALSQLFGVLEAVKLIDNMTPICHGCGSTYDL